jgi:hypothetical protein
MFALHPVAPLQMLNYAHCSVEICYGLALRAAYGILPLRRFFVKAIPLWPSIFSAALYRPLTAVCSSPTMPAATARYNSRRLRPMSQPPILLASSGNTQIDEITAGIIAVMEFQFPSRIHGYYEVAPIWA